MPYITLSDHIEIEDMVSPEEFIEQCDSSDLKRLRELLKYESQETDSHGSLMEVEFYTSLTKLQENYHSLPIDVIDTINEISSRL